MEHEPAEALKQIAEEVARWLSERRGGDLHAGLRMLGLADAGARATAAPPFLERAAAPAAVAQAAASPRSIGPWDPVPGSGGLRFRRREHDSHGYPWSRHDWADVEELAAAKPAELRVVLIGESVARGFHFDPIFTPGQILQHRLDPAGRRAEVVDLACVGIHPAQLERLVESAVQLRPDVVVLLAGNNWAHTYWSAAGEAAAHHGAVTLAAGVPAYAADIAAGVGRLAARVLERLGERIAAAGSRLVVVVPEFNLRDWHHEALTPRWLAGGALERWLALRGAVDAAAREAARELPLDAISELLALDGGLVDVTQEWMGRALLQRGDRDRARQHLEAARDQAIWLGHSAVPRCPAPVQAELRRMARHPGVEVVDLPVVFRSRLGGGIPGRDLFIDYVHLTPAGMNTAMRAVSDAVVRVTGGAPAPGGGGDAGDGDLAISPAVYASGCFLAAIHNAHASQPEELVAHWCQEAVTASREVLRIARDHFAREGQRHGRGLLREMGDPADPVVDSYLKVTGSASNIDRSIRRGLDLALGGAPAVPGAPAAARGGDFEAGAGAAPLLRAAPRIDLEFCRVPGPRDPGRAERELADRAYARRLAPRSELAFTVGPEPLRSLEIVLRIPLLPDGVEAAVQVALNGRPLRDQPCGRRWRRLRWAFEDVRPAAGVNHLQIRWPDPAGGADDFLPAAIAELRAGRKPSWFWPYGDLRSVALIS